MVRRWKKGTLDFAKFSLNRVIDHIFPTRQDRGQALETPGDI